MLKKEYIDVDVSVMLGKNVIKIDWDFEFELEITTYSGEVYKMYHKQECCECMYIETIVWDLDDLMHWTT